MRNRFAALVVVATTLTCCGATALAAAVAPTAEPESPPSGAPDADYTADGRVALAQIARQFATLASQHGWQTDRIYTYPDDAALRIEAWRTPATGPSNGYYDLDDLPGWDTWFWHRPTDRPWGGRSAFIADPEGNRWEFCWNPAVVFDDNGGVVGLAEERWTSCPRSPRRASGTRSRCGSITERSVFTPPLRVSLSRAGSDSSWRSFSTSLSDRSDWIEAMR